MVVMLVSFARPWAVSLDDQRPLIHTTSVHPLSRGRIGKNNRFSPMQA
jgi:hypothetical protein